MRFINTLRKRGLALLLAVLMCLSMMPTGALAVGDDFDDEGTDDEIVNSDSGTPQKGVEDAQHEHNEDGWVCELVCANEDEDHVCGEDCPDREWTCTPSKADTDLENEEIPGDSISVEPFSLTNSISVKSFSANTLADDYKIEQTIYVECTKEHTIGEKGTWKVLPDETHIKITNTTSKSCTIQAIAEGEAILEKTSNKQKTYYKVIVTPRLPIDSVATLEDGKSRIFVFLQLDVSDGVDTTGWKMNPTGWFTIGYFDFPSDQLKNFWGTPNSNQYWIYAEDRDRVTNYLTWLSL